MGGDGKDAVLTVLVAKRTDDEVVIRNEGEPESYKRIKDKDKK